MRGEDKRAFGNENEELNSNENEKAFGYENENYNENEGR